MSHNRLQPAGVLHMPPGVVLQVDGVVDQSDLHRRSLDYYLNSGEDKPTPEAHQQQAAGDKKPLLKLSVPHGVGAVDKY